MATVKRRRFIGWVECRTDASGVQLMSDVFLYHFPDQSCTRPQHLPGQIHSAQDTPLINDATLENTVVHTAVFEEDGVGEAALAYGAPFADGYTSVRLGFFNFCTFLQTVLSHDRPRRIDVRVEGSDVEPWLAECEAMNIFVLREEFFKDATDIVGMCFCVTNKDRECVCRKE